MNKRLLLHALELWGAAGLLCLAGLAWCSAGQGATTLANNPAQPVRVALMDFSTDDNSHRNFQAAADFAALLQVRVAVEPGVEWVERTQLELARKELGLSAMESFGGAAAIRCGSWTKADWLITGQFSLDDQNRRTLFLEIIDLQHADVLTSETLKFTGKSAPQIEADQEALTFAATGLRQLLLQARSRREQTTNQVRLAPLFLVDVSRFAMGETGVLETAFNEALERAVATNRRIRLIRFPKAYQALEESELVLDGLAEADPAAWRKVADLYVWGSYERLNPPGPRYEPKLELTLHLWDGASKPVTLTNALRLSEQRTLPPRETGELVNRLVCELIAQVGRASNPADSEITRRELARSMQAVYLKMNGSGRPTLGLQNQAPLMQAIRLLEAACFFDPDNAEVRMLHLTCRWGWWMDFGFTVKNEFWSKWRRSDAWGRYVDRFGLHALTVPLPFPYQQTELPKSYLRSLEEVIGLCPEYVEGDEFLLSTCMREAQFHGFPKEIPLAVAADWKHQLEAELARRKAKVEEFSKTNPPASSQAALVARPAARPNTGTGSIPATIQPQPPTSPLVRTQGIRSGIANSSRPFGPSQLLVPAPSWLKAITPQFAFFRLFPPKALSPELHPAAQQLQFPRQFEVRTVNQIARHNDSLFILAVDERSAQSSAAKADAAAEPLNKRGRLWHLPPGAESPRLFEPELLSANIHSFVFAGEKLWVAGEGLGCLDLETRAFRKFGLNDGLHSTEFHALAFGGGGLFAAAAPFKLFRFLPQTARWGELPLPPASLSSGRDAPCLVAGNARWLAYLAGSLLVYDVPNTTWAKPEEIKYASCLAADETAFWTGTIDGLGCSKPGAGASKQWPTPATIEGLRSPLLGAQYTGGPQIPESALTGIEQSILRFLESLQKERIRRHAQKNASQNDPLRLNWRIPGEITSLATDGDFLWLGAANYFGNYLIALHQPSQTLAGYVKIEGQPASIAVADSQVFVGTAYGDKPLLQIEKKDILSVPRNRWVDLAISPTERRDLIRGMPLTDQAIYAYYADDDAQIADLLENLNPGKATLEQMFLLAFSYDACGLNHPGLARTWFERIVARSPDSPWAKAARSALASNDEALKRNAREAALLERYDRNHDGTLDPTEREAMKKDPKFQQEEASLNLEQLDIQLAEIVKRFDRNGDGKLNREELQWLRSSVLVFSQADPGSLAGHKILVAPLLSKHFPSEDNLLKHYDANHDGGLDANELRLVAHDVQKDR